MICGLIWFKQQLLISRRLQSSHLGGYWEFPGGKQERGESDQQTLQRELAEELAIEVTVDSLFYETSFSYPETQVRLRFYSCRLKPGPPAQALAATQLCWVTPADLANYDFPVANEPLIHKLIAGVPGEYLA